MKIRFDKEYNPSIRRPCECTGCLTCFQIDCNTFCDKKCDICGLYKCPRCMKIFWICKQCIHNNRIKKNIQNGITRS